MLKVIVEIKRPNGITEQMDMTAKILNRPITKEFVQLVRDQNNSHGKGQVIRIIKTESKSNYAQLAKSYNDAMNEGGDGFVPDMTKHPKYKTWEETTETY